MTRPKYKRNTAESVRLLPLSSTADNSKDNEDEEVTSEISEENESSYRPWMKFSQTDVKLTFVGRTARLQSRLSGWHFIFCLLVLITITVIVLLYFSATQDVAQNEWLSNLEKYRSYREKLTLKPVMKNVFDKSRVSFDRMLRDPTAKFDILSTDVMVFIHIQKTAGTTFEKYLTRHLDLEHPCKCQKGIKWCECHRHAETDENWLFSRFSTGWSCGLHADWTELVESDCVDNVLDKKDGWWTHQRSRVFSLGTPLKRRYFYTTLLREPIARTLSEYRHVQRGATWQTARFMCHGRPPTPEEWPLCYDPSIGWSNVTLADFTECPFNPARNRQTRMLADLSLVGCYDRSLMSSEQRDHIMLQSAKHNLQHEMAFFGLSESLNDTQYVFEQLFDWQFKRALPTPDQIVSKSAGTPVSPSEMVALRQMNHLDLQLYEFAVELFAKRLEAIRQRDEESAKSLPLVSDSAKSLPLSPNAVKSVPSIPDSVKSGNGKVDRHNIPVLEEEPKELSSMTTIGGRENISDFRDKWSMMVKNP